MGWLWGSSNDDDDPLRKLDPSLREFLQKESPIKYTSSKAPVAPPEQPPKSYREQLNVGLGQNDAKPQTNNGPISTPSSSEPSVPSESLYPDGRYAHLWKTYRPLAEIEAATKTDQEKLQDVLEGYKERKAQIGRAALENCAIEHWEVNDCFRNGSWKSRFTMCSAENRTLERCYTMQAKFLRALGYLSTFDRPSELDEKIQMHADTLYHRMLDQERAIEAAKAAGQPIPTFPPIMSSSDGTISEQASSTSSKGRKPIKVSQLPRDTQLALKKRVEGLSGEEREIEERAILAEMAAGEKLGKQLGEYYKESGKSRKERLEKGNATVGDHISSWFGW